MAMQMTGVKYEVRCCCDPGKLLGWMVWPLPDVKVLRFPLTPNSWEPALRVGEPADIAFEYVELELHRLYFAYTGMWTGDAIKDNGVPIEKLRLIHGFVENR